MVYTKSWARRYCRIVPSACVEKHAKEIMMTNHGPRKFPRCRHSSISIDLLLDAMSMAQTQPVKKRSLTKVKKENLKRKICGCAFPSSCTSQSTRSHRRKCSL